MGGSEASGTLAVPDADPNNSALALRPTEEVLYRCFPFVDLVPRVGQVSGPRKAPTDNPPDEFRVPGMDTATPVVVSIPGPRGAWGPGGRDAGREPPRESRKTRVAGSRLVVSVAPIVEVEVAAAAGATSSARSKSTAHHPMSQARYVSINAELDRCLVWDWDSQGIHDICHRNYVCLGPLPPPPLPSPPFPFSPIFLNRLVE